MKQLQASGSGGWEEQLHLDCNNFFLMKKITHRVIELNELILYPDDNLQKHP